MTLFLTQEAIDGVLAIFPRFDPRDAFEEIFSRKGRLSPEKQLLLAIVYDALHCLDGAKTQGMTKEESFAEASAWVMAKPSEWIFSFENCMEALGLDPSAVRKCLKAKFHLKEDARPAESRTVRHGRPRIRKTAA